MLNHKQLEKLASDVIGPSKPKIKKRSKSLKDHNKITKRELLPTASTKSPEQHSLLGGLSIKVSSIKTNTVSKFDSELQVDGMRIKDDSILTEKKTIFFRSNNDNLLIISKDPNMIENSNNPQIQLKGELLLKPYSSITQNLENANDPSKTHIRLVDGENGMEIKSGNKIFQLTENSLKPKFLYYQEGIRSLDGFAETTIPIENEEVTFSKLNAPIINDPTSIDISINNNNIIEVTNQSVKFNKPIVIENQTVEINADNINSKLDISAFGKKISLGNIENGITYSDGAEIKKVLVENTEVTVDKININTLNSLDINVIKSHPTVNNLVLKSNSTWSKVSFEELDNYPIINPESKVLFGDATFKEIQLNQITNYEQSVTNIINQVPLNNLASPSDAISLNNNKIINLANPVNNNDAVNKITLDNSITNLSNQVNTQTNTLSSSISQLQSYFNTNSQTLKLVNLTSATNNDRQFLISENQVNSFTYLNPLDIPSITSSKISDFLQRTTQIVSNPNINIDMNNKKISNLPDPINSHEPTTKNYVDVSNNILNARIDILSENFINNNILSLLGIETGNGFLYSSNGQNIYRTIQSSDLPRLDEINPPTSSLSLNLQKITNLGFPTDLTDSATKQYVDDVSNSLDSRIVINETDILLLQSYFNNDRINLSNIQLSSGTENKFLVSNSSINQYRTLNYSDIPSLDTLKITDFTTSTRNISTNPISNINMNNNRITNLANPNNLNDAANKIYVDGEINTFNTNIQSIINTNQSSTNTEINTLKSYFTTNRLNISNLQLGTGFLTSTGSSNQFRTILASDIPLITVSKLSDYINETTNLIRTINLNDMTVSSNLNLRNYKITNLIDPTNLSDSATKNYVDSNLLTIQTQTNSSQLRISALESYFSSGNLRLSNLSRGTGFLSSDGTTNTYKQLQSSDIPSLLSSKISDFNSQVNSLIMSTNLGSLGIDNDFNVNNYKVINIANPINNNDATNKIYVDTISTNLQSSISTNRSDITQLQSYFTTDKLNLSNLTSGTGFLYSSEGVNSYKSIDTSDIPTLTVSKLSDYVSSTNLLITTTNVNDLIIDTNINAKTYKIVNLGNPTLNTDASNKFYVDNQITTVNSSISSVSSRVGTVEGYFTGDKLKLNNFENTNAVNGDFLGYNDGVPVWLSLPVVLPSSIANQVLVSDSNNNRVFTSILQTSNIPSLPISKIDVSSLTSTENGYVVTYNNGSTSWSSLPVSLPSSTANQVLISDTSNQPTFVNSLPLSNIPSLPISKIDISTLTSSQNGYVLTYNNNNLSWSAGGGGGGGGGTNLPFNNPNTVLISDSMQNLLFSKLSLNMLDTIGTSDTKYLGYDNNSGIIWKDLPSNNALPNLIPNSVLVTDSNSQPLWASGIPVDMISSNGGNLDNQSYLRGDGVWAVPPSLNIPISNNTGQILTSNGPNAFVWSNTIGVEQIFGTKTSSTYLRGDGIWATPPGTGTSIPTTNIGNQVVISDPTTFNPVWGPPGSIALIADTAIVSGTIVRTASNGRVTPIITYNNSPDFTYMAAGAGPGSGSIDEYNIGIGPLTKNGTVNNDIGLDYIGWGLSLGSYLQFETKYNIIKPLNVDDHLIFLGIFPLNLTTSDLILFFGGNGFTSDIYTNAFPNVSYFGYVILSKQGGTKYNVTKSIWLPLSSWIDFSEVIASNVASSNYTHSSYIGTGQSDFGVLGGYTTFFTGGVNHGLFLHPKFLSVFTKILSGSSEVFLMRMNNIFSFTYNPSNQTLVLKYDLLAISSCLIWIAYGRPSGWNFPITVGPNGYFYLLRLNSNNLFVDAGKNNNFVRSYNLHSASTSGTTNNVYPSRALVLLHSNTNIIFLEKNVADASGLISYRNYGYNILSEINPSTSTARTVTNSYYGNYTTSPPNGGSINPYDFDIGGTVTFGAGNNTIMQRSRCIDFSNSLFLLHTKHCGGIGFLFLGNGINNNYANPLRTVNGVATTIISNYNTSIIYHGGANSSTNNFSFSTHVLPIYSDPTIEIISFSNNTYDMIMGMRIDSVSSSSIGKYVLNYITYDTTTSDPPRYNVRFSVDVEITTSTNVGFLSKYSHVFLPQGSTTGIIIYGPLTISTMTVNTSVRRYNLMCKRFTVDVVNKTITLLDINPIVLPEILELVMRKYWQSVHYHPCINFFVNIPTNNEVLIYCRTSNNTNAILSVALGIQGSLVISNVLGIAQNSGSANSTIFVAPPNSMSIVHSGLTVGQNYYINPNATITTTPNNYLLGTALSSSNLFINPNLRIGLSDIQKYISGNYSFLTMPGMGKFNTNINLTAGDLVNIDSSTGQITNLVQSTSTNNELINYDIFNNIYSFPSTNNNYNANITVSQSQSNRQDFRRSKIWTFIIGANTYLTVVCIVTRFPGASAPFYTSSGIVMLWLSIYNIINNGISIISTFNLTLSNSSYNSYSILNQCYFDKDLSLLILIFNPLVSTTTTGVSTISWGWHVTDGRGTLISTVTIPTSFIMNSSNVLETRFIHLGSTQGDGYYPSLIGYSNIMDLGVLQTSPLQKRFALFAFKGFVRRVYNRIMTNSNVSSNHKVNDDSIVKPGLSYIIIINLTAGDPITITSSRNSIYDYEKNYTKRIKGTPLELEVGNGTTFNSNATIILGGTFTGPITDPYYNICFRISLNPLEATFFRIMGTGMITYNYAISDTIITSDTLLNLNSFSTFSPQITKSYEGNAISYSNDSVHLSPVISITSSHIIPSVTCHVFYYNTTAQGYYFHYFLGIFGISTNDSIIRYYYVVVKTMFISLSNTNSFTALENACTPYCHNVFLAPKSFLDNGGSTIIATLIAYGMCGNYFVRIHIVKGILNTQFSLRVECFTLAPEKDIFIKYKTSIFTINIPTGYNRMIMQNELNKIIYINDNNCFFSLFIGTVSELTSSNTNPAIVAMYKFSIINDTVTSMTVNPVISRPLPGNFNNSVVMMTPDVCYDSSFNRIILCHFGSMTSTPFIWLVGITSTTNSNNILSLSSPIGIVQQSTSAGNPAIVALKGAVSSVHSGLNVGNYYYINPVNYSLTIQPTPYLLGYALSTSELYLTNPSLSMSSPFIGGSNDKVVYNIDTVNSDLMAASRSNFNSGITSDFVGFRNQNNPALLVGQNSCAVVGGQNSSAILECYQITNSNNDVVSRATISAAGTFVTSDETEKISIKKKIVNGGKNYLERILKLPIYSYSLKENPKEVCVGVLYKEVKEIFNDNCLRKRKKIVIPEPEPIPNNTEEVIEPLFSNLEEPKPTEEVVEPLFSDIQSTKPTEEVVEPLFDNLENNINTDIDNMVVQRDIINIKNIKEDSKYIGEVDEVPKMINYNEIMCYIVLAMQEFYQYQNIENEIIKSELKDLQTKVDKLINSLPQ